MIIRVFDTETTGFPTETDPHALVQVGFCDLHYSAGNAEVGGPHSMLVNPGRPIPAEASAVHHIVDEDVTGAPPPDAGCLFIASGAGTIGPADCYAAFNLDFDKQFFGGGTLPAFCIYKAALRVFPDAPSHSNQVLRYWLQLPILRQYTQPAHDAGADAYVSAHILKRILDDGSASIDDMLRWSKGPALLPRVTFGKHKGSKWEDLPTDYLDWISRKSDLDRDTKANARHWLKQRGG